MKKLSLVATLLLTTSCYANSPIAAFAKSPDNLADYEDIVMALVAGQKLRIAIVPDRCTIDGQPVVNTSFHVGVYTPNEIILTKSGSLATSMQHFTTNDPRAPGKPVYQFAAYKISQDNSITVSMEVFAAATFASIAPKVTYDCRLGDSAFVLAK